MKLLDLIITANQSLLRNKARTILTVIAIFIGATTLSLTNGIGAGITSYLDKQVGNLGNSNSLTITAAVDNNNLSPTSAGLKKYDPEKKKISAAAGTGIPSMVALTNSDIEKIKAEPNIVSVEPLLSVTTDYIALNDKPDDKYEFTISQTVGTSSLDMSSGKAVSNEATDHEITVPTSYATSLGFTNTNDAVGKKVKIGVTDANAKQSSFEATIVGVQQKTLVGSTAAFANNAVFQKLYETQSTGITANSKDAYGAVSAIYASNLDDAQIKSLKDKLKEKGYDAKTLKDEVSIVFTIITAITYIFNGFAAITLVAAAFGIVNTLYMSVSERTREIGLMKALGMGKNKIFTLFSIEAILIGFWGSLLGVGFANLIGILVNSIVSNGFLKDFTGLQLLSFPATSSAIIVVGIVFIAFLAGTLPARRASQKDPIEALRYE